MAVDSRRSQSREQEMCRQKVGHIPRGAPTPYKSEEDTTQVEPLRPSSYGTRGPGTVPLSHVDAMEYSYSYSYSCLRVNLVARRA